MTGHAVARFSEGEDLLVLEAKSVNGKHLSLKTRLPGALSLYEQLITGLAKEAISRGSLVITCREFSGFQGETTPPKINRALAEGYLSALEELPVGVEKHLSAAELLRLPGVIKEGGSQLDEERLKAALRQTTERLLEGLLVTRNEEGNRLWAQMLANLGQLKDELAQLRQLAELVPQKIRETLTERIAELTTESLNSERLEQEVAHLATKADITEELDRLDGHLTAFAEVKDSPGRRLNFFCQEILRELNTCGSKATGTKITPLVLNMKVRLDQLREQAANLA